MTFLQWAFLFGAATVIGPIVAHLLGKPRFRRVPFTMLQFLRSGQSRRYSRRQLQDLLVLLLRCLIIVLIAVLFAQPLLRVRAEPTKHISVHWLALDDSESMSYRDGGETLFDRMVRTSLDHVRRAPEDAAFTVWSLASGRSSHGLTKAQAMAEIRQLKTVPRGAGIADLFSALKQAGKAASPDETLCLFLASDFTPAVLQALEQVPAPAVVDELHYERVTPSQSVNNAAVLGARLAAARGGTLDIDVVVCLYGLAARPCTLTATSPGLPPVSVERLALTPGRPRVVRVQMESGPGRDRPCRPIELTLTPGDNLSADNTYRLAAHVPSAATRSDIVVVDSADEAFLFETALQALSTSGSLDGLNLRKVREDRLTGSDLADADVVVFASVPQHPSRYLAGLRAVAQQGGRLVFFMSDTANPEAAGMLWREGFLPALPERWVAETAYPEPTPTAGASLGLDSAAAKSLVNYRLDRIALKGHWVCKPAGRAECLWRLASGEPLIYGLPSGSGLALLVNTSIDGSLGLLAKSPAWVAFCRYLVGWDDQARQFCFSTDERPVLHLANLAAHDTRTTLSVENCDGRPGRASVQGGVIFMPLPAGLGWMKTTQEPVLYAGINLPAGETDVSPPTADAIAEAMQRAFITSTRQGPILAQAEPVIRRKPVWRYVAWAAILLLLSESALANRLKR